MGLLPSWFTVQVAFAPMPVPFFQALREIEVETSIGSASIFRMHFDLSRTFVGDFDALAFDIFRPLVPIRISVAAGLAVPQVLINGYIKDHDLKAGGMPGTSRLEVVGMDALGTLMTNSQRPFPRPNQSESSIAETIFFKHTMIPEVDFIPPTRTERDTLTNQIDYDAPYLMQLASCNYLELYIQPDPFLGVDVGHLHRKKLHLPHQGVLSIDFGTQSNLTHFNVANDMLRPTGVEGEMIEQQTRARRPLSVQISTELPMGAKPTLAHILPPPIAQQLLGCAANPTEAQLRAGAYASATSLSIRAQGEVDGIKFGRPLRAGLPVMVRGAGRLNSGLYYVDSVTHRISRDDYRQSFTASRNATGLTGAEIFSDPLAPAA